MVAAGARAGGVSEPSFSVLGHWPIHFRSAAAPPSKPEAFWEFSPCAFRNTTDGPYFDYVLVRGRVDPFADAPPGPVFMPILRESDWTLYAKVTNAESPPDSAPDEGPCVARPRKETRR